MRWILPTVASSFLALVVACGPTAVKDRDNSACPGANLDSDVFNCGECGTTCGAGELCIAGACDSTCDPGQTVPCYEGAPQTEDVGPCRGGTRTCLPSGTWSACQGQVVPAAEVCGNGIDENCSGEADENLDQDGDGYTTCDGDCCDSGECQRPELVNPGAFDAAGNTVDDDCDGAVDNTQVVCDMGLSSRPNQVLDYARAMDLCQMTTEASNRWGVISATLTKADGSMGAHPDSASIRPSFGSGLPPQAGMSYALLSSGRAAAPGQSNPNHVDWEDSARNGISSGFPSDFLTAHGGALPNAPGCPAPLGLAAQDPVMLTLRVRVPSNAKSFSFASNFFSAEYPEYVCSPYNDFFVVLLDSAWSGQPANPSDKNLAFYRNAANMIYPVGVNLAYGNTGLFTQCQNGATGCEGTPGTISTCTGTGQLAGTGFDRTSPGACAQDSIEGGATGWLVTSGNVKGGEIITLRIAIWDTSDQNLDSLVVLDNFQWSVDVSDPGTVIGRQAPAAGPRGDRLGRR